MRFWPYSLLSMAVLGACGSRTGLLVPGDRGFVEPDGAVDEDDSGQALDAGTDATEDVAELHDALPPIDVSKPVDAFNSCPDAGATLVYVVSQQQELLSFYPPTAEFKSIGPLRCPIRNPSVLPFSMAVDHTGIAYVLYSNQKDVSELFRVSTATASCRATGFATSQPGFGEFGMGYSHDATGTGETLFVASGGRNGPSNLGTIDTQTFALNVVGTLVPNIGAPELSGTGAGDLFAFFATRGMTPCDNSVGGNCPDSAIGQIDKTTGRVTGASFLMGHPQGDAWAFAFWGGAFYTFTDPDMSETTVVNRFDPSDGSVVTVARRSDLIVGAGVSTCAPAQ
jgi:hypothetical protein